MPIDGHVDYQKREYCKDVQCPVQVMLDKQRPDSDEFEQVRAICKANCIHSTHEFHYWLIEKGYEIVRPAD